MTYKPGYSIPEILKMRGEGMTQREIGLHFGISGSRVGQLVREGEERARRDERTAALCRELRASNDLNRKLSLEDTLYLLDLSGKPRNRLRELCERENAAELSLLDLMDMLLPVVGQPRCHFDLMPAYRIRGLAQKTYAELIRAVTALDCGKGLDEEWTARKKHLKDYLSNQHGLYPYILHGRGAALA